MLYWSIFNYYYHYSNFPFFAYLLSLPDSYFILSSVSYFFMCCKITFNSMHQTTACLEQLYLTASKFFFMFVPKFVKNLNLNLNIF